MDYCDRMHEPIFSVVIPTRNRAETLPHAIRSCINQDFAAMEILIVDNASEPETRFAVEQFTDSRIRYVRHDEPLSMTANWNAALSQTRGEWVCFIGDDDGLTPGALSRLHTIASSTTCRAMRWDYCVYTWPDFPLSEIANRLCVTTYADPDRVCSGMEALIAMADMPAAGPRGPSVYHGMIHRSLIDEALATGPVFQGRIPDYFSGTLFAALADSFLQVTFPASIAGLSGKSNGAAHIIKGEANAVRDEFLQLSLSENLHFHEALPQVNLSCVYISDAVLRIRDRLGLTDPRLSPQPAAIADICIRSLWQTGTLLAEEEAEISRFCEANSVNLSSEQQAALESPTGVRPPIFPDNGAVGVSANSVTIDGNELGLRNLTDAAFASAAINNVGTKFRPIVDRLTGQLHRQTDLVSIREQETREVNKQLVSTRKVAAKRQKELDKIKRSRVWRARTKFRKLISSTNSSNVTS